MSMNLGEDVQKIILDFIGIIDHSKKGCHAYGKKGRCGCETVNNIFCKKHIEILKIITNDNDVKYIAFSYLLLSFRGPESKIPKWLGKKHCCPGPSWYYPSNNWDKNQGYCICPWCIKQYFKFFDKFVGRIAKIKKIMDNHKYPYNSIIDLFNNNVLKINKAIKKKGWKTSLKNEGYNTILPKKKLIYHYGSRFFGNCPQYPDPISIIENSIWSFNEYRNENFNQNGFNTVSLKCPPCYTSYRLIALCNYEMINVVLFKKILKNYTIKLPDDLTKNIMSFIYDKKTFKKSFLYKRRIHFWKSDNDSWMKVNEHGDPINVQGNFGDFVQVNIQVPLEF